MIKVLDEFISDKIAAGEVIERPLSVVKELIENSIDANASSIVCEIRNGGKSYIRVTDDGTGISSDEAETAFLRHATSKISSINDLNAIASLGFRGEALASISAVSRLTMLSRTQDDSFGTKLILHAGRPISNERTGTNPGTTIIVEDIFYNTPARRKFMKSDARESSAIIELVQQLAVCYSGIRFMMINNGQTLFATKGDGDTLTAVRTLYPDIAGEHLIEVSGNNLIGYISDPGVTRPTRKSQLFYVNGRLVDSEVIEKALVEGYRGRIFSGHPIAILFIDCDPSELDVNIHPGKREVRFLRQDDIKRDIAEAVSLAVMGECGIPSARISDTAASFQISAPESKADIPSGEQQTIREFLSTKKREPLEDKHSYEYELRETSNIADYRGTEDKAADFTDKSLDLTDLVLKGYLFDTYIIMQSSDTAYIFDQHAAHERVFYEKFMREYENGDHIPQSILTPFTLSVSADVYSMDRSWLSDLEHMGFSAEDFGERTFMVRAIPPYMSLAEAENFIRAYLDGLDEVGSLNSTVIDKLIMRSCKSAVKGGNALSELEISDLMKSLSECDNPYSCPHGRPTFIKMTLYDFDRAFKRK